MDAGIDSQVTAIEGGLSLLKASLLDQGAAIHLVGWEVIRIQLDETLTFRNRLVVSTGSEQCGGVEKAEIDGNRISKRQLVADPYSLSGPPLLDQHDRKISRSIGVVGV